MNLGDGKEQAQDAGCSKAEGDQTYAYRMGKEGGARVLVRNGSLLEVIC